MRGGGQDRGRDSGRRGARIIVVDHDEEREAAQAAEHRIEQALRYGGNWTALGWTLASDAWLARTWATHGARVVQRLAGVSSWYAEQQRVPAVLRGVLRVVRGVQIGGADVVVLPPTLAGWREFLALAPASGMKFTEGEEAGVYSWERKIPRDLLSDRSLGSGTPA